MRPRKGRLTTPLVRDDGALRAATWDEALDRAAAGFARARDADASTSSGSSRAPRRPTSELPRAEVRRAR